MSDFSLVRDSKSTRLPHSFIAELEKRLQGIMFGTEKRQEYKDPAVKRSFTVFLNSLRDPMFKAQMEKGRRAEDLMLIFFSNTTKELSKGKPAHDDGVKRMVDRHVALFVRLMSLMLKENGWATDRPELVSRLATLEDKLLKHDENLSSLEGDGAGTTVEEIVPLTYAVKDMAMVKVVAKVFGLTNTMAESDVTKNRPTWTEKAALQDLKTYQTHLNLHTRRTLSGEDFDTIEAYELWKKAEGPELSQMMLAIMQVNPELAKSTSSSSLPQFSPHANGTSPTDSHYSQISRTLSQPENLSSYVLDLPADMSSLNLTEDPAEADNEDLLYTFIPADPRSMFRFILSRALSHDLKDESLQNGAESGPKLLSKDSTDLLNEVAVRWRIPKFSRVVLFLDVIREMFVNQEITLEQLDQAFNYVREPISAESKTKQSSIVTTATFFDRNAWTVADFALMRQLLAAIYESLYRDLFGAFMQCYDQKPSPLMSMILTVVNEHIRSDPSFVENHDSARRFKEQVSEALTSRARDIYSELVDQEIPQDQEAWEFYHVMQLSTSVLKLCEKIQKRYRKNPEILGVNLLILLLESVLPTYAEDSKAMIERIMDAARIRGEEVPIQDGFDLYKVLSQFRQVHSEALPNLLFPYSLEDLLGDFVWRWIRATEGQINGWVENAIRQDSFVVRSQESHTQALEELRCSVSIVDVFRSFNQVIEQISNLGWDDDLSYAKFMTALSKSLGAGISRYCEIVEQIFTKEMDRLTPEQEAAATLSRQEKWMQMAKDTWQQKDKVQPFQFYPQSFVKLNNINFAIRRWDDLEHEINVDACADVINKNTPPAIQRQKKVTNYVFTIKLVEGEDLKAMDVQWLQ